MAIRIYANNILTHVGQTDVPGFSVEIAGAATKIKAIPGLDVIVGYHGTDPSGDFDRNFDATEKAATTALGAKFQNATLTWYQDAGMTDVQIQASCKKGNVFFTWCDSDARVRKAVPSIGAGKPI